MTDKREESFEDRFALKVKPDTRMRQVRFLKSCRKLKKMNPKGRRCQMKSFVYVLYLITVPDILDLDKGQFIDFRLKTRRRLDLAHTLGQELDPISRKQCQTLRIRPRDSLGSRYPNPTSWIRARHKSIIYQT